MKDNVSPMEVARFLDQCQLLLSKTFPNFPNEKISHDTVRHTTMMIGKDKMPLCLSAS